VRKHLPALVVFLWLTALALSAFVAVLNLYQARIQENFAAAANGRILALERSLQEKLLIMESIRSLYALFDGKPQAEFGAFVQPFEGQLEGVQGLLWVVPVPAAERAAFESARQQEGIAGFQITERNAAGNMERAAEREVYFPVYPLLPLDVGEAALGFDMASSPERREAIQRALATGTLAASSRVSLIQEQNSGQYGFLLFSPLFTDNATGRHTIDQLLGFVTGVFRISNIVNDVEDQLTQEEISLTLRDLTAPPEAQLLYTLTPESADSARVTDVFTRLFQPEDHVAGFTLGGRYWEITASAMPAYMADKPPVAALLILATGLFLALGTTAYLILRQIHAERIRSEQEKRESLENQLIRAQKLEAIGQLVGGIAHDFNNLLTSIIGYGELASDSVKPDSPVANYMRIILQSSDKGKGLIRKLLSFSRNQPTRAESRELQPLVENIIAMLQPVMTARIHMLLVVEPDLPLVSVDSTSFDQLLVNLCVNARDAISGAGQIRIGLHRACDLQTRCLACGEAVAGNWVMLSVADTGSGMAPEVQAQIFKPFFTTKEDGKGTGLGLPIINNVLHGCGGHILVDSAPGKGTTFKLLFPAN
jgi:signal transduction histidine kinase